MMWLIHGVKTESKILSSNPAIFYFFAAICHPSCNSDHLFATCSPTSPEMSAYARHSSAILLLKTPPRTLRCLSHCSCSAPWLSPRSVLRPALHLSLRLDSAVGTRPFSSRNFLLRSGPSSILSSISFSTHSRLTQPSVEFWSTCTPGSCCSCYCLHLRSRLTYCLGSRTDPEFLCHHSRRSSHNFLERFSFSAVD